jgi:hypothetical protein
MAEGILYSFTQYFYEHEARYSRANILLIYVSLTSVVCILINVCVFVCVITWLSSSNVLRTAVHRMVELARVADLSDMRETLLVISLRPNLIMIW